MKKLKIRINCVLCDETHEVETQISNDWNVGFYSFYDSPMEVDGLCPKHIIIKEFISEQCSGCAGGWTDCQLFREFAYSKNTLKDEDFTQLEKGICPKRTNGTGLLGSNGIDRIDLSQQASKEAGKAFADAIKEYIKMYH